MNHANIDGQNIADSFQNISESVKFFLSASKESLYILSRKQQYDHVQIVLQTARQCISIKSKEMLTIFGR